MWENRFNRCWWRKILGTLGFYNTEAKKSVFEVLDAKYIEKKTSWLVDGLVDLKNVELV